MASRKIFANRQEIDFSISGRRGVTLVEILITFAITALFLALGLPLTWEFYQNNELRGESRNIVSYLETARTRSMANRNQTPQGVSIGAQNVTIFEGRSFATRNIDKDEIYPRSRIISTSGAVELVFSQLSGTTSSGVIILTSPSGTTSQISINSEGLIQ